VSDILHPHFFTATASSPATVRLQPPDSGRRGSGLANPPCSRNVAASTKRMKQTR